MVHGSVSTAMALLIAWAGPVTAQPVAKAVDRSLPWVTADAGVPGVVHRTFDSAAAAGKVSYHVYTPAEYDDPTARLPVLYWLHGTLGGVEGIRPLASHFDAAMRAGRMPPMLVVFVNGLPRRLWADSKTGAAPVETTFIADLIPEVDRSFRTLATREGRILEGFSMGGYGAARLGFAHPELFAGISILAGGPLDLDLDGPRARRNPRLREFILREVCGGDIGYFRAISPWTIAEAAATSLRDHGTVIRQAVGSRDDTGELNRRFHERMTELAIAHDYREVPDVGHDARAVLTALLATDGDFYRRALAGQPRPDPDAGAEPEAEVPPGLMRHRLCLVRDAALVRLDATGVKKLVEITDRVRSEPRWTTAHTGELQRLW